jgi:hypothetical protein
MLTRVVSTFEGLQVKSNEVYTIKSHGVVASTHHLKLTLILGFNVTKTAGSTLKAPINLLLTCIASSIRHRAAPSIEITTITRSLVAPSPIAACSCTAIGFVSAIVVCYDLIFPRVSDESTRP